jgi:SAM-dependent methyltransferase
MRNNKDIHGHTTLDKLSNAKNFNRWLYLTIKPWLSGEVIEIGSGIGNISSLILQDGHHLVISETNTMYLEILNDKFIPYHSSHKIIQLNLVEENFDIQYQQLLHSFDVVIAINVIEHISNDIQAFSNAQKLLNTNGRLIVLVPNSEFLYNKLDQSLGHIRRYNKDRIKLILDQTGLIQEQLFYFNAIGVFGWWISGSILRNKTIPQILVNIFEFLVPYTSWLDQLFRKYFGLSIVLVCQKSK